MILSQYNIYLNRDREVSIFNTLSSALVKLDSDTFNSLLTTIKQDSSIAKQLHKMGILVNNRDEEIRKYKYIQYTRMFRNDHILLYICPTMNCNFSCSYCFEGTNKKNINMTEDVEDAIIKFLLRHKHKKISLIWFGGEPLLRIKIIESIVKKLNKNEISYSSSMITNGSLLKDQAIEVLKNMSIEFIQISMDGTKIHHDRRRYFRSGKGSFDVIIDGIERLIAETSIIITIQVTIDKTNLFEYENLLDYFNKRFPVEMKKQRIRLNYNIVKDRTNFDKEGTCMSHHDYFDFLDRIKHSTLSHKAHLFLPDMAYPCMYNTVGSYAIAPDGEIFKCIEHIGNKSKSIGNIVTETISLSKLASCFFKCSHFENEECLNCPVLPVCGGGCPLDRELDNGDNTVSCSFYKTHLSKILSLMEL